MKYVQISPAEKLNLLKEHSVGITWNSLQNLASCRFCYDWARSSYALEVTSCFSCCPRTPVFADPIPAVPIGGRARCGRAADSHARRGASGYESSGVEGRDRECQSL